MAEYYDRDGTPITYEHFSTLLGDSEEAREYKRVAKDEFALDGVEIMVSTVWLGLNHNWDDGPPLIFETMVFGTSEELQWRYSHEGTALKGHQRVVRALRTGRFKELLHYS